MALEITVSNSAELMAALGKATGGETIILEAGDYGKIDIWQYNFTSPVNIVSNELHGAKFDAIKITDSSNISFDGIEVEYIRAQDGVDWEKAVNIARSTHIEISNADIHGSMDGNYDNDVFLISIRDSAHFTLTNSDLHDGVRAFLADNSDYIKLVGNEVYDIRSDGFDFAEVKEVLIADNYMHDFHPNLEKGDHADGIQFWTAGTESDSENVVISNNTFLQGNGGGFQSIFIHSTIEDLQFVNFDIFGNVIYNDSIHGITVTNARDINIENNTVIASPNAELPPSILIDNPKGVITVSNNVSNAISTKDSDLVVVSNNVVAQSVNENLDTHYSNLFLNPYAGGNLVLDDLAPKPGSILDGGIGALTFDPTPDETTARVDMDTFLGTADSLLVTLDASMSANSSGLLGADARYRWDFGDGTFGEGLQVSHVYENGGSYEVKLNIELAGETISKIIPVLVSDPHLLSIGDIQTVSNDSLMIARTDSSVTQEAVQFDGTSHVNLGRPDKLFNLDEFTLSVDFKPEDADGSGGALFYSHVRLSAVIEDGKIKVNFYPDDGDTVYLTLGDANLYDGNYHNLSVSYNNTTGVLSVSVDGQETKVVNDVFGGMGPVGSWDVVVGGTPWGSNFTGSIKAFDMWSADAPIVQADTGTDTVAGGDTGDTITGDTGTDTIAGGDTGDTITGDTGTDTVAGGDTGDTITGDTVTGDTGTDIVDGVDSMAATDGGDDLVIGEGSSEDLLDFSNVEFTLETLSDQSFVGGASRDGDALVFNGDGYVELSGQNLQTFESLSVSMDLQTTFLEDGSRPIWAHGRFGMQVRGDDVVFRLFTTDGRFNLRVKGLEDQLTDGNWHRLGMTYDQESGTLSAYLDGELVQSMSGVTGALDAKRDWPVTIGGTQWGREIEGTVENVNILNTVNDGIMRTDADGSQMGSVGEEGIGLDSNYDPDDYWDTAVPSDNMIVHL
ncbi:hypothetical protein GCM10017044_20210 [Kordiimonas sediminis]|uniref:PKD domain-containing protein n=2 Tax=Kordiimonas sediminis TaxID=1735581 RepID=A0A919AU10_9PROT|nr:hypothetical protein GCM10017044_20210 [Kordiimonas sediminis]